MSLKEDYQCYLENLSDENTTPEIELTRKILKDALANYESSKDKVENLRIVGKLLNDISRASSRLRQDKSRPITEQKLKLVMQTARNCVYQFLSKYFPPDLAEERTQEFLRVWQSSLNV